jgi:hypothetical protein
MAAFQTFLGIASSTNPGTLVQLR